MKIATIEKLKFKNLQRRLHLPLWQAVGLLEAIWKVTYRNAPAGDIGRLTDDEIAAAIEWDGDATVLVDGLVHTKWLDRDPVHRLLVHDWEEECESWHRGNFERHKKEFAKPTQSQPVVAPIHSQYESTQQNGEEPRTKPSLTSHTLTPLLPPSPTIDSGSYEPEPIPADWDGVAGELRKENVGLADQAVRSAIARGCLPNQAMDVIRQFREFKPAFGGGMLKSKIENLQPGKRTVWPDVPDAIKARIESERNAKRTAEASKAAKVNRQTEKQKRDARERVHGPELDAMPDLERENMIAELGLEHVKPTMQRDQLLLHLETLAKT